MYGEKVDWSTTDHLLALIADQLAGGNWQRGGGKGPRPKPLPRPGQQETTSRRIGTSTTLPLDEARERLDRLHGRTALRCEHCGRECGNAGGLASHLRAHEREGD